MTGSHGRNFPILRNPFSLLFAFTFARKMASPPQIHTALYSGSTPNYRLLPYTDRDDI
jgi:hypothetical protein